MTAIDLLSIERCFEGVIPSPVATCSVDGVPNVIGISHVYLVDQEHVALSEQFTKRTRANLEQAGKGTVLLCDPVTTEQYRLRLRFVRRETEGRTVEKIRATVESVAAATGMTGVFNVRAALVCRVTEIEKVEVRIASNVARPTERSIGLVHVGQLAERLHSTEELGALSTLLLDALVESFGFRHSMLLLADETGEKLFTFDSRGFRSSGVGSEVHVGEGVLGQCAQRRTPVRIAAMSRLLLYTLAGKVRSPDEISLPELPNVESLLAVPLVVRQALVGLLVLESAEMMAFSPTDETAIGIVARLAAPQLARARSELREDAPHPPAAAPMSTGATSLAIRYFEENDSVFVNGEYLVKGVAGRILWLILGDHFEKGRSDFTNRELRLDPRLGLSALNDNLEARMLLLRRRLEESLTPIRLPATGRGRFRFECDGSVSLEKIVAGRV